MISPLKLEEVKVSVVVAWVGLFVVEARVREAFHELELEKVAKSVLSPPSVVVEV